MTMIVVLMAWSFVAANAQRAQQPCTLPATPSGRIAAGLKPAYLNNLPSADTVKNVIQGADPTDTLERQVAVFNMLGAVIQHHLAADRGRYDLTPDEQVVTCVYRLAAYQMEQDYKKAHSEAEAQAFSRRHGQYEMDSAMQKEIDSKLLSAAAVAENRANDRSAFQQLVAHNEAILRQNEEYKRRAAAAAADPHGAMVLTNDPTSLATRRCLELGGSQLECVGKGFGKGLMSLIGVDTDVLFGSEQQRAGLTVAGAYRGANGVSMNFGGTAVGLGSCGRLDQAGGPYTISTRGNSYALQVQTKPRPFTVLLGPDGNITGPGLTEVEGQVIVGYNHATETTRRVSDWQIVGQRDISTPVYAPKLDRCNIGALRSGGPIAAADMSNLMTEMFSMLGDKSSSTAKIKTYPAGMRMMGAFANAANLKIEFALEGAVLDCGEAHVARQYRVENTGSSVRVVIDNGSTPLVLTMQPDGSLAGTASVDVAGRLVTGMSGNDVTFQPVRQSCTVGTLRSAGH